ncbi:general substrate transporter [Pandoraea communis]|uniref:General substrate transporter n=1 Tax=Pandoraea communis TaxID=2508297 RepID=A0A5E4T0U7_9BURK|nr:MFS transporter [Pandoraea communis]VVD81700.1 general substrate transporter [Pandoraea communis]
MNSNPLQTHDYWANSAAKTVAPTQARRAVVAASLGNILEWYDFVLYAYFSPQIAHHFFPAASEATSFLVATATFGVGFVARPLGAAILGAYGDRAGRKASLLVVILLMAIGTAMIGLTPGFDTAGVVASMTIVIARILQGFASGGGEMSTSRLAPRSRQMSGRVGPSSRRPRSAQHFASTAATSASGVCSPSAGLSRTISTSCTCRSI